MEAVATYFNRILKYIIMSSRRTLNQSEGNSNPATRFLEWKSNDKCFAYYDKEKKENVKVKLPLKFQFLEHFHTVKGWHDASSSGIYSNEVKFTGKDELTVKAFKGGEIATGLYKDVRGKIRDAGGKYHRSIYALTDAGNIVNLSFKGAVVSAYSEFCQSYEASKFESNWIEVNDVEDKKKGATKYSVPIFEIGKPFNKTEMDLANEKYEEIVEYYNRYSKGEEIKNKDAEPIEEDDLAF